MNNFIATLFPRSDYNIVARLALSRLERRVYLISNWTWLRLRVGIRINNYREQVAYCRNVERDDYSKHLRTRKQTSHALDGPSFKSLTVLT